jgi:hypothetical protein
MSPMGGGLLKGRDEIDEKRASDTMGDDAVRGIRLYNENGKVVWEYVDYRSDSCGGQNSNKFLQGLF